MSARRRSIPAAVALAAARSDWRLWRACWEGREPAELLTTQDREDLVWQLHALGWSDGQIADHTWMTEYTTARIRERIGLAEHEPAVTTAC